MEMDWVRACKGEPGKQNPFQIRFLEAGPYSSIKMVVMGVLRCQITRIE